MSYKLSYSEYGFVLRFKGNITIEELNNANGRIHGHVNFDFHRYQIIDFLSADISSITSNQAKEPAAMDAVACLTLWRVKVAFVAVENKTLSVINDYIAEVRQLIPRWEFDIFSTCEDALRWAKS